jgi:type IV pilus assembly protein PilC
MFNKISNKEFIEFNRVLSLLLISRIGVNDSLELLYKQTRNEKLKDILKTIVKDINSGKTLSESFGKFPETFNAVYLANLKVGEETGQLAEVLTEFTEYQDKFQTLKNKMIQAARYPVFVLMITIGVVAFMMLFLIPTFEGLFTTMKSGLPPLTAFIVSISNFIINHGIELFVFIAVMIYMLYKLFRNKNFKKNYTDRYLFKLPLVSKVFKHNLLARFSLVMSILLRNKVGLLESLEIARNISPNNVFRTEIKMITKRITKGETIAGNLGKSMIFDITFVKMISAGEASSELEKVFGMMSEYYTREFDHYLENITSLLEPMLILFIGLIVAVILVAMYMPMFEIVNYLGV